LLRNGDEAGYLATCRVLARADLRTRSPAIACPTLLIGGTADQSTPPDLVQATAAAIPGARAVILEGSGHIPAIDNPGAVASLLGAFHQGLMQPDPGMAIRRQVLGDAHVNQAEAGKTGFDAPFQDLITQSAWARVWGRGTSPLRERSRLTVALLAGLGKDHELAMHIRATANTGATEADIMEALLHVAIYAGVPRANHAIRIARDTFAAMAAPT
jgi:4-carboxymuconolactone decarboxylase